MPPLDAAPCLRLLARLMLVARHAEGLHVLDAALAAAVAHLLRVRVRVRGRLGVGVGVGVAPPSRTASLWSACQQRPSLGASSK